MTSEMLFLITRRPSLVHAFRQEIRLQLLPLLFRLAAEVAGHGLDGDAVVGAEPAPEQEARVVLPRLVGNLVGHFRFLGHFSLLTSFGNLRAGLQCSKFPSGGHGRQKGNVKTPEGSHVIAWGKVESLRGWPGVCRGGYDAEPSRYFAPVGAGTPPDGSRVTAKTLAARASAGSCSRISARPAESVLKTRPGTGGLPSAMNQSW